MTTISHHNPTLLSATANGTGLHILFDPKGAKPFLGVRVLFLSGLLAGTQEAQTWEKPPSIYHVDREEEVSSLQAEMNAAEWSKMKQTESLLTLVAAGPAEAWLSLDSK